MLARRRPIAGSPARSWCCGILQVDAHAHHQVGALFRAEEVARRELGALADVLDGAGEDAAGQRIDVHLGALADARLADVALGHEEIDVGPIDRAQRRDRAARAQDLAGLGVGVQDRAVHRRAQHVVAEARVGERERGAGGVEARLRRADLLAARAGARDRQPLLGGLALGGRARQRSLGVVELLRRRCAGGAQRARALRGVARGGLGGLRGAQLGLGGADLLAARARLHQVQLRLRRRDLRRLAVALRALERVVEPREDLAGAHDLPAPNVQRRQPPRQLEAEHALVDLDHALQLVARRSGAARSRPARPSASSPRRP